MKNIQLQINVIAKYSFNRKMCLKIQDHCKQNYTLKIYIPLNIKYKPWREKNIVSRMHF